MQLTALLGLFGLGIQELIILGILGFGAVVVVTVVVVLTTMASKNRNRGE
jgi:hypothetical protein